MFTTENNWHLWCYSYLPLFYLTAVIYLTDICDFTHILHPIYLFTSQLRNKIIDILWFKSQLPHIYLYFTSKYSSRVKLTLVFTNLCNTSVDFNALIYLKMTFFWGLP